MKWKEENHNKHVGIDPISPLSWEDDYYEVKMLYASHANKYSVRTLKFLLMDTTTNDKAKLIQITDLCNESIRAFNSILFRCGGWNNPNRFNEIPNIYQ